MDINYFTVPYQDHRVGSWLDDALQSLVAESSGMQGKLSKSTHQLQYMG